MGSGCQNNIEIWKRPIEVRIQCRRAHGMKIDRRQVRDALALMLIDDKSVRDFTALMLIDGK